MHFLTNYEHFNIQLGLMVKETMFGKLTSWLLYLKVICSNPLTLSEFPTLPPVNCLGSLPEILYLHCSADKTGCIKKVIRINRAIGLDI